MSGGFSHFVTSRPLRLLPVGAIAGWALHSLESAAFSRPTPIGHWLSGRFSQKICDEIILGRSQLASLKLSIACLGAWEET